MRSFFPVMQFIQFIQLSLLQLRLGSNHLRLLQLTSLSVCIALLVVACSTTVSRPLPDSSTTTPIASDMGAQPEQKAFSALSPAAPPTTSLQASDLSPDSQPSASEIVRLADRQLSVRSLHPASSTAKSTNPRVSPQRIEFEPNQSTAKLEGSALQGEQVIYQLAAQSGQRMDLLLTSIADNAVFDVIAPNGEVLMDESTNTQIQLPLSGDYQIVISGIRGNTTYRLDIAIR